MKPLFYVSTLCFFLAILGSSLPVRESRAAFGQAETLPVTHTWTEQNITCESCHGPGKAHSEDPTTANIVNPARLSTERSIEVCLACHQAGKPAGNEYAWAVGYQPGKKLSDYWHGFEPEAGKQTSEFWSNGTAHKNRVQGNTFTHSVMHAQGLQCSTCHDSHGSRNLSMTVKSASTNALCLTCHGPGKTVGPNLQASRNIRITPRQALAVSVLAVTCLRPVRTLSGPSRVTTPLTLSPPQRL